MGINNYPQNFPAPQTPLIAVQTGLPTQDLRFLLVALFNRTGQGAGSPIIKSGLAVVGGAVFPIIGDWNQFTSVANGGIAQLPAMSAGGDCIIWNDDPANALSITPQNAVEIDVLGVNAGYMLAAGKMQWFRQVTPTLIHSMQLG
jgi:hypothetical protein